MLLGRPEPCRPLTRRPGAWAPIPGTSWKVQMFPTQIRLQGPEGERLIRDLPVHGVVQEWTAQLDLDHYEIRIWGRADDFFLFRLFAHENAIVLKGERRAPFQDELIQGIEIHPACAERLQFGNHSVQDVDHRSANSLTHIVPTWFRLGMALPESKAQPQELSILGLWAQATQDQDRHRVAQSIQHLHKTGFQDLWSPETVDHGFWGFGLPPTTQSSFQMLAAGARLLRQMTIEMQEKECFLLPFLPKELPAGRFLHAHWPGVGILHLEWTRGQPRRMILEPSTNSSVQIRWSGDHVRVSPMCNGNPVREGSRQLNSGEPLEIFCEQPLLFDRFFSA